MLPARQGSFRLFRLFGINVYLHWLWFLAAYYFISVGRGNFSSIGYSIADVLALFLIVTMHEFGHSLACRSVGGKADTIVLWPLGGVAFVSPPQRPGATLWSIAAGPLVNVILFPILLGVVFLVRSMGWPYGNVTQVNLYLLVRQIFYINTALLIFNILPIYPLDGGQILRSLLWFVLGRARSLMVTTIVGFVGVAGLIMLAIWMRSIWFGIMCLFILTNCWNGLMHARVLAKLAAAPRREGFTCPECKVAPPRGELWTCGKCRTKFDTFETLGVCPKCGTQFAATACSECGAMRPIAEWIPSSSKPPPVP